MLSDWLSSLKGWQKVTLQSFLGLLVGITVFGIFGTVLAQAPAPAAFPSSGETVVTAPIAELWSGVAGTIQQVLVMIIGAGLSAAAVILPAPIKWFLTQKRLDQIAQKGATAVIGMVSGAVKDKKVTIDVGNELIASWLVFLMSNAPSLVKTIGDSLPVLTQKALAAVGKEVQLPDSYDINKALDAASPQNILAKAREAGTEEKVSAILDRALKMR